ASASSIFMNASTSFSSGTIRFSISICCSRLASWRSISASLVLYGSSSRFSCSLASRDFCALSLASRWLLKYVKYSAALNNPATASTNPHCFIPDMSLKFMALSLGLAPVNFAGQLELERLHILYAVVLKRFLDLDVLEVPGLLQIRNQVRN